MVDLAAPKGVGARGIALGAGIAALVSLPLVISVGASASAEVLLSRGRPVAVSSIKDSAYPAVAAVDGTNRTRWSSAEGAGSQWLRVDLGAPQSISRVKLVWETAYARSYQVQTSADGAGWTDLYTTRQGDGGTDDLKRLAGTGRYLRILGTQRATAYGYSLWELQVYGAGRSAAVKSPIVPTEQPSATGLDDPHKKDLAMRLVSTAENSSVDWRAQFGYIEDIGDGRGYTGGIIGFCSGTSDMLALVQVYTRRRPANPLARYLPALRRVDGSDSHEGLDPSFPRDWKLAAEDPMFRASQENERDRQYFDPAVALAKADGLRALGQFAYYDAAVMHGQNGMRSIRSAALRVARTPTQGGDERVWLAAYLDARVAEMKTEEAHSDTTRVDTAQRAFLKASNLDLNTPLSWSVYGDKFSAAS